VGRTLWCNGWVPLEADPKERDEQPLQLKMERGLRNAAPLGGGPNVEQNRQRGPVRGVLHKVWVWGRHGS
jgi:hypothetical protein